MSSGKRNADGTFLPGNRFGFKRGQSGNPNGRPLGSRNGTSALRRMAKLFVDPKTGLTAEEAIAAKLIGKAVSGDLAAIREFLNRVEGKPGQRIEVTEPADWRERASQFGLTELEVVEHARKLLAEYEPESFDRDGDPNADPAAESGNAE